MTYDVIFLQDHVYIGMEDVAITYRHARKEENLSYEELSSLIKQGCKDWENDPVVQKEKELAAQGKRSFYPSAHEAPCTAIICKHGTLPSFALINSDSIYRAIVHYGATEIRFREGYENFITLTKDFEKEPIEV